MLVREKWEKLAETDPDEYLSKEGFIAYKRVEFEEERKEWEADEMARHEAWKARTRHLIAPTVWPKPAVKPAASAETLPLQLGPKSKAPQLQLEPLVEETDASSGSTEEVCTICGTEPKTLEGGCCLSACCLLRQAEGRYELPRPNEESETFEKVCALRDEVPELDDPKETLILVGACDGIGGARRGMELLGLHPAVYLSLEIDPDCVDVVQRGWPDALAFGDVNEFTDEEIQEVFKSHPKLRKGLIVGDLIVTPSRPSIHSARDSKTIEAGRFLTSLGSSIG